MNHFSNVEMNGADDLGASIDCSVYPTKDNESLTCHCEFKVYSQLPSALY